MKESKAKPKYRLKAPVYRERALKPGLADRFVASSFRLFRGTARSIAKGMPQLEHDIQRSQMTTAPEAFVSVVVAITLLSLPITLLGIYITLVWRSLLGLALLPATPITFVIALNYPKLSASSRASAMDHELPFVVGYITTLAGGGISPITTLRRLTEVDLYPAASKEAKRIVLDIDVFGMDPNSALEKAARNNPNKALADFLAGYTSLLKTGGDIVSYMETKLRDIFAYRTMKTKSASELIGIFTEAYITLTVILGISLFILFAVQAVLVQGGSSSLINVIIFSTVFTPLISIVFIYIVHTIQYREPFTYYRPYIVFSLSFLPLPLMLLLPVELPFFLKVALGLFIAATPPAIVNYRHSSHKRSVENALPSFIRDIAEIRKTGLAPEKCIEQLSHRNYGALSQYVVEVSSQLSWGVPLRKTMINFSQRVRSWLARTVAFLILEVVDVGGGTVHMFGSLADFTQRMSEIEREKRSALRPYIFIPYFGAVMIVVTTIMMLYFLTSPIGGSPIAVGTGVDVELTTIILLSAAIVQSWIMGLVAGKMGEESVAAGFKHSAILVVVSIAAIYVTSLFFAIPT